MRRNPYIPRSSPRRSRKGSALTIGIVAAVLIALAADRFGSEAPGPDAPAVAGPSITDLASWASRTAEATGHAGEGLQLTGDPLTENMVIVFDGSGSMTKSSCAGDLPSREQAAKQALSRFLGKVPERVNLGLVLFDSQGLRVAVPLGPDKRAPVASAVAASVADGGTPLGTALSMAYAELAAQGIRQSGYGRYTVLLVTDGKAEPDREADRLEENIDRITATTPVEIVTVGFCLDSRHALNRPGVTQYRDARNPAELEAGLAAALAESEQFQTDRFVTP
jgi:Ca-activated chloride channel homolog